MLLNGITNVLKKISLFIYNYYKLIKTKLNKKTESAFAMTSDSVTCINTNSTMQI
jgi:hypothetical protein